MRPPGPLRGADGAADRPDRDPPARLPRGDHRGRRHLRLPPRHLPRPLQGQCKVRRQFKEIET